ncbi:hypothetical protein CRENBAI_009000 [Crenichthys baileyi]|uniref:Uncharacterized protein n=1 Tax=Crenichthys baileyi TaxID=28760 RepID=A0AAV9R3F8_9TELE
MLRRVIGTTPCCSSRESPFLLSYWLAYSGLYPLQETVLLFTCLPTHLCGNTHADTSSPSKETERNYCCLPHTSRRSPPQWKYKLPSSQTSISST